jgi:hypothetical protein
LHVIRTVHGLEQNGVYASSKCNFLYDKKTRPFLSYTAIPHLTLRTWCMKI